MTESVVMNIMTPRSVVYVYRTKGGVSPIPNILTSMRIAGGFSLAFIKPLGTAFYCVYSLCGVTDVLDGAIARATDSRTRIGSTLDSAADLIFYAVTLVRLLPVLRGVMPWWIWRFVGVVLAVRLCSYAAAALRFGRFASLHTYLNKLTGAAVFLLPYTLGTVYAAACGVGVCTIALLSSGEELAIHLLSPEYENDLKSLLLMGRVKRKK